MRIRAAVISHPGHRREKNEDNFCFCGGMLTATATPVPIRYAASATRPLLFGVFDGMGGIAAGERASAITADIACRAASDPAAFDDPTALMLGICHAANDAVCREMREVIGQRIGTTASMLALADGRLHLCNIGDSPILRYRDGVLSHISHEHTERENYLRVHGADAAEGKKFKLTQHIGIFPEELVIEPYVFEDALVRGDRLVICSDGLTDMVAGEMLAAILGERRRPAKTALTLLERALAAGGKDNTTVIVIDIV